MTLRDRKRALRDSMMASRDAIDADFRADASRAIAIRIESLDAYRRAAVVLLTLPYRSEWNATLVAQHALADGKTVRDAARRSGHRMLRSLRIRNLDVDIEAGYHGIPEPRDHCSAIAAETIEWVLVPGVAFDADGRRLGLRRRVLRPVAAAAARTGAARCRCVRSATGRRGAGGTA
jgi:5-formyltetrahydrofolate cyclo-ligase